MPGRSSAGYHRSSHYRGEIIMMAQAGPAGLIHALLLDGKGGALEYPFERVADWRADQGCLWLHFDFEEAETQAWLENESGLNDIAFNALVNPETLSLIHISEPTRR